jgi:hypothetical protein
MSCRNVAKRSSCGEDDTANHANTPTMIAARAIRSVWFRFRVMTGEIFWVTVTKNGRHSLNNFHVLYTYSSTCSRARQPGRSMSKWSG